MNTMNAVQATLQSGRARRGITLLEILISILIMGVGVTSIMTLFPLGMLNVRAANRYSRSTHLVRSSTEDAVTRKLLNKFTFANLVSGVYYTSKTYTPWPYDPWLQDTPSYGADPIAGPAFGAYRGDGSFSPKNAAPHDKTPPNGFSVGYGLPVAYDPLWRATTGIYPGAATEARFASGIGWVRPDPNPGTGTGASTLPSAHGLQRITNFPLGFPANVPDIFVSPEDMVLQSDTDASKGVGAFSPIVPELSMGTNAVTGMPAVTNDWRYTWMFTGFQANSEAEDAFEGDVVVFENRPFSVDPVTAPFDATVTTAVAGETVVEAIFGYTNNVKGGTLGYGATANKSVLLRWPASMPDPEVKVGGWIADVTYERNAAVDRKRRYLDPEAGGVTDYHAYQRCHWYLIAKRTQASAATNAFAGDAAGGMREMVVWTATPLKELTLLSAADGSPYHVNAALVSPYVVNVFPRLIYSR